VSYLEAELKSTSKALKDDNAAKTSAEKASKAAQDRASKAEKALSEVAKKQAARNRAVVEQLDAIVASVGSKFFGLPLYPAILVFVDILLLAFSYFRDAAEQLGEVMKLCLECAKDPLLDSVDVLESNWRIVRDILQRTRHVLPCLFVGLFPRKKDELPVGNLRKLVKVFDTIKDPILPMKLSSVKRAIKGTIALTQSHGEEVDWEKVGSSYARPLAEMKELFKKAKEYAPKLMSLNLPLPMPSASAPSASAPSSSTPAPMDPTSAEVA
jgi:hypothetical protein